MWSIPKTPTPTSLRRKIMTVFSPNTWIKDETWKVNPALDRRFNQTSDPRLRVVFLTEFNCLETRWIWSWKHHGCVYRSVTVKCGSPFLFLSFKPLTFWSLLLFQGAEHVALVHSTPNKDSDKEIRNGAPAHHDPDDDGATSLNCTSTVWTKRQVNGF